ncbi:porin [Pseudomonas sessilinigenes]|uniref:Alginate export family protein n=1 Tax=Pseudomonas sessilinigenes TaxID=658629 RepID=A0ABX8MFN8_9PSED|nr:alginate export family protein [Pseudomonas sessilinigenes]AZC24896.1 hypothetical protein C4K39_3223 [Pseudomonas sessilinigenes]QXH37941.1 alginate export family protein [Pseudomonas sessilinigenes]
MKTTTRNLALSCMLSGAAGAHAQSLYRDETSTLDFNLELTAASLYSSFDFAAAKEHSRTWVESYARGTFSGTTPVADGSAFAKLGFISSKLFGDGDPAGSSTGHEYRTDVDNAYVGWKNDWLEISTGRQPYVMGDAFLIAGDQLNFGERAGNGFNRGGLYYLAGRRSFAQATLLRLQPTQTLRIEGFHLESDNDGQGSPQLKGINIEYDPSVGNNIAGAYLRVDNVDRQRAKGMFSLRQGLDVYNLRGKTNLGFEALSIEGGYAAERSSTVQANAWYAGARYQFDSMPLTPEVGYRYSRFSGDDPTTQKSEQFDPLFYGSIVGNPAWVQGEIAGTFAAINTNARIHRASLRTTLNDQLAITAMAYRFSSQRSREHLGDELDLYFQITPTANLLVIPIVGLWKPQQGAKALYGESGMQTFLGMIVSFGW